MSATVSRESRMLGYSTPKQGWGTKARKFTSISRPVVGRRRTLVTRAHRARYLEVDCDAAHADMQDLMKGTTSAATASGLSAKGQWPLSFNITTFAFEK